MTPGRVYAHAGQPFKERRYDHVIVGAGRLGLATAFYLGRFCPQARILVVEQGGIPSETGALLSQPGLWHGGALPHEWRTRARWVRQVWLDPAGETGVRRPHDPFFVPCGWAHVVQGTPATVPESTELLSLAALNERLGPGAAAQFSQLLEGVSATAALFGPLGGHGKASTLALSYGYGAVAQGADLLLNTRARLTAGGIEAERLDVTREMQVVVAERARISAEQVIVAAGSAGPALLEQGLGLWSPHGRAYAQHLRLEVAPAAGLPIIEHLGFILRPDGRGFTLVPPRQAADPGGDLPQGGRLLGVPVGVRQELLEALLGALEAWPLLGSEKLNLGKQVSDLPGAWEARPRGGWPLWEQVADGLHLLLGGPESDRVGPAVALDLAAHLGGVQDRPWD